MRPQPTWDEVRARTEQKHGGMTTFCGWCSISFEHCGLPCGRHATPEEKAAIEELVKDALHRIALGHNAGS